MIAFNVVLALVTFLKGKLTLGMLSVFVPLVGVVAAVRLAKPRSLWTKWFYGHRPAKMTRAAPAFRVPTLPTATGVRVVGGRLVVREEGAE